MALEADREHMERKKVLLLELNELTWNLIDPLIAEGKLPTFLPPDLVIPTVGTRDIGLAAAKALMEGPPSAKTEIIELAGPRDYSPRDIASVLSKILGKPVEVEAAPLEAVVPAFTSIGMSANVAGLFREMFDGIARGLVVFEGKGARAVLFGGESL